MNKYPKWDEMPDFRKLEYLKEWNENLDRAVKTLREDNQALFERLRQAEAKLAGTPPKPMP